MARVKLVDKRLFDITAEDLRECPEWYFPADDSVDDEYVARPSGPRARDGADALRIQRCHFVDALGREFEGFVYYYADPSLASRQPNVWASGLQFAFWFGIQRPDDAYVRRMNEAFPHVSAGARIRRNMSAPRSWPS